jgi:flagellar motility protein MotE (MotC chaperone)
MAKDEVKGLNETNLENNDKKSHNKGNPGKAIGLFFVVFLGIPLIVFISFYFFNDTVRNETQSFLKEAPGFVGEYFEKFPSEEEKNIQLRMLAENYIDLEVIPAADKLLYVKSEDKTVYYDLIDQMKDISYKKTEKILEEIQKRNPKEGLLNTLYTEINDEKQKEFDDALAYLNSLETYQQIEKIKNDYLNSYEQIEDLNKVLEKISKDKLIDILYYIDEDSKKLIMSKMDLKLRDEINKEIEKRNIKEEDLIAKTLLYEEMDSKEAAKDLTNQTKYELDDLAYIYNNMSTLKAADVLRNAEDRIWIENLYEKIRINDKNKEKSSDKIINLDKTMNFLNEYDKKIEKLADIYIGMTPEELKSLVEKMLLSDEPIETFEVDESEIVEVSDSKIILDVLNKFDEKVLSLLLGQMDPRKAAELTRRLTI